MQSPKLLQAYLKLSEQQKAILRLKALYYFEAPIETIRSSFLKLSYLSPVKQNNQEFNTLLNSLKSTQFLDRKGLLPKPLVHFLTVDALNNEYASQYVESIKRAQEETKHRYYLGYFREEDRISKLRLALYGRKEQEFINAAQHHSPSELMDIFKQLFLKEPLDLEWLKTRPLMAQYFIFHLKLNAFCLRGELRNQIPVLLAHYVPLRFQKEYSHFGQAFLLYDILAGDIISAEQTLHTMENNTPLFKARKGMVSFLASPGTKASVYFEEALKTYRQLTKKKKVSLDIPETLFYILELLRTQSRTNYHKIQTLLSVIMEIHWHKPYVFEILQRLLWRLQGLESKISLNPLEEHYDPDPLSSAIGTLAHYWFDSDAVNMDYCKKQFSKYQNLLPLVAKIFAEILYKKEPNNKEYKEYLSQDSFTGLISFVDIVQMGERWQRTLDHLHYFFEQQGKPSSRNTKRLCWFFDPKIKNVEALEQSFQANGTWTKGRSIALKRLYDLDPKLDYLTEDDKKVIKTLNQRDRGWSTLYEWDRFETLLALIGHPCVYHAKTPDLRLELVAGSPELVIKHQEDGQFHLSLSPMAYDPMIFIEQETSTRLRLIPFSKSLVPLVEILGFKGIKVPERAKDHLVSLIQKASPVLPIHSDIEAIDIPAQEGGTTPCLQIIPLEKGLKINLFVRPFKDQGPYFRPGHGRSSVLIYNGSQPLKANRLLKEEKKAAEEVRKECHYLHDNGDDEWVIDDPQECLETLSSLQEMQEKIKIEWPEGQRFSVTRPTSFEHMSLKITQEMDWFKVDGSLQIDEETVISFERLLDLLDQAQGRFIPLAEHKFITLTNHLKKQLQDLKVLTEVKEDGYRLHSFGSFALKNLTDKVRDIEADEGWKSKLKRFSEVEAYDPKVPPTLQAELRDYQQAGFKWLCQLSHLGVGACLADDMGLGKTLQALAVILTQAPKGPCIVVAPTSVCHNWISEIERFAPTLSAHILKDSKRDDLVESLQEMDVLVCSYSLLQQEVDLLTSKNWQMIVLDEAQAIKNPTTKRFQSAIKLQGNFKLALTGTPIENNLEEIWSLFRFIAPGLLGSRESFQKRFLLPMAREKDQGKQSGLKNVIQTLILRRTKKAVLQELPPRTEKTILIDISPEEASFYEALRRQVLTNLSSLQDQKGQRKIHILAEITRLRRACCHPSLVEKDITLPSSKLKVFLHLVDELLQNNHQALVFSQYVGYLQLIREELNHRNIPYQYLDGSTPAPERKKQVSAFQEGKSPLFLLSLKAGGSGLNLTAADYVIHLDPWWNPAVEDQASDRAHRLGQKRPVTIYRLIVKDTIEEKILHLHAQKREMAEELLEGSHIAEKMTEEDLMKLIDGSLYSEEASRFDPVAA